MELCIGSCHALPLRYGLIMRVTDHRKQLAHLWGYNGRMWQPYFRIHSRKLSLLRLSEFRPV